MTLSYSTPDPVATGTPEPRDVVRSVWRGARLRCPRCGTGRMFGRYLKVRHACDHCGEELHHQRADDAPAYFTMFIVGHVALGGLLAVEQAYAPDTWVQATVWCTFAIVASLWLLPRIKGILIAYQWALRMHGFGGETEDVAPYGTTGAP